MKFLEFSELLGYFFEMILICKGNFILLMFQSLVDLMVQMINVFVKFLLRLIDEDPGLGLWVIVKITANSSSFPN